MKREIRYLYLEWLKRSDARGQIAKDIKRIKNKTGDEPVLTLSSYRYFYDCLHVEIEDLEVILAYPVGLGLYMPQIYVFPDDQKIIYDVIRDNEAVMISIKNGTIRRRSNNKLLNLDYLKFIKTLSEKPVRIDGASGLEVLADMVTYNATTFEAMNALFYRQAVDVSDKARDHLEKWFQEEAGF